jgi:hypothetical protein
MGRGGVECSTDKQSLAVVERRRDTGGEVGHFLEYGRRGEQRELQAAPADIGGVGDFIEAGFGHCAQDVLGEDGFGLLGVVVLGGPRRQHPLGEGSHLGADLDGFVGEQQIVVKPIRGSG